MECVDQAKIPIDILLIIGKLSPITWYSLVTSIPDIGRISIQKGYQDKLITLFSRKVKERIGNITINRTILPNGYYDGITTYHKNGQLICEETYFMNNKQLITKIKDSFIEIIFYPLIGKEIVSVSTSILTHGCSVRTYSCYQLTDDERDYLIKRKFITDSNCFTENNFWYLPHGVTSEYIRNTQGISFGIFYFYGNPEGTQRI
jgi:hypothetical protein